jgi:hypothetical protein
METRSNLISTNPSLIKLVKTETDYLGTERRNQNNKIEGELNDLIGKYERAEKAPEKEKNTPNCCANNDLNLNFQRDGDTADPSSNEKKENSKSKSPIKIPLLNLNMISNNNTAGTSSKTDDQEQIFDPVTERECSFIQNISIDHSTFVGDADNKENDVVLCISNLDLDNTTGDKKGIILQSEEKLFSGGGKKKYSEYDIKNDMSDINPNKKDKKILEKKNLLNKENVVAKTFFRKYKIPLFVIVIVLTCVLVFSILYYKIFR